MDVTASPFPPIPFKDAVLRPFIQHTFTKYYHMVSSDDKRQDSDSPRTQRLAECERQTCSHYTTAVLGAYTHSEAGPVNRGSSRCQLLLLLLNHHCY